LTLADPRTSRILATVLLFAAVLAFAWAARKTLIAFLFAIFFAYLIAPLVDLVAKKTSRGRAIAIVYLVVFVALAVLFLFIGPNIIHEAQRLSSTLPDLYEKIASGQIAWQLGSQHGWSYASEVKIQHFLQNHRELIINIARDFASRVAEVGKNAWWLLLIPILAVFFLKDGGDLQDAALQFFERRRQREFVESMLQDVHVMLAHFIRAQLILAALTGIVFSLALTLMRVPYGYVMGVLAGFLEFIPVVGPLVAFFLIVGVAVGMAYKHLIILVLVLGAWRVVQDYVNSPRIMGSQVQLHPLAALFGVLAGAEVGGVVGVYLSIPIMASLRIFWRKWRAYSAAPKLTPVNDVLVVPENVGRNRTV